MKVLITTDTYAPQVNGVVTSIMNLRKGLEADGHEVRILTLSHSMHTEKQAKITALRSIPLEIIYPGARLRVGTCKKAIDEIIAWKPDIVHSQCELNTFRLAKKIAAKLHIPLIHTYHTLYEDYTHYFSPKKVWGTRLVAKVSRSVGEKTDCMIAPSQKVARVLSRYDVSCPVRVIPTGIDLSNYRKTLPESEQEALRKRWAIPCDAKIAVFVGRIAKEKNLEELLAFWKSAEPDAYFLIVGDGPYRKEIEEKVAELDLIKRVRLTGMVPPSEVRKYYRLADVFLSASSSETQGLTYVEALASGTPLLCKKDPCLDDVICEEENGHQYENAYDFSKHLERFLNTPNRCRIAGTADAFSAERFTGRMEELYRECIANY